ncbi:hypothetical protein HDU97_004099 [Phlyctochytrium planicorne]|nr:hypothetical protein HDU97_004099 [Phlyctochytrium planicorne]
MSASSTSASAAAATSISSASAPSPTVAAQSTFPRSEFVVAPSVLTVSDDILERDVQECKATFDPTARCASMNQDEALMICASAEGCFGVTCGLDYMNSMQKCVLHNSPLFIVKNEGKFAKEAFLRYGKEVRLGSTSTTFTKGVSPATVTPEAGETGTVVYSEVNNTVSASAILLVISAVAVLALGIYLLVRYYFRGKAKGSVAPIVENSHGPGLPSYYETKSVYTPVPATNEILPPSAAVTANQEENQPTTRAAAFPANNLHVDTGADHSLNSAATVKEDSLVLQMVDPAINSPRH